MTRQMIDATHSGLPGALPAIRALPGGSVVAWYGTGSPDIAWTEADLAEIPAGLVKAEIDQGFTGSPKLNATVRDVEQGAWAIGAAVNRTGWLAARPTLYLGFPDTAQEAFNAGWRGDVWLVHSQPSPPSSPPPVPAGLNVVAVQWDFTDPDLDRSVVFDPTWPLAASPPPPPPPAVFTVQGPVPGIWERAVTITGIGADGNLWIVTTRDGRAFTQPVKV